MELSAWIERLGEPLALAGGGALVGLTFGFMAQRSRFCLRAAVIEFWRHTPGQRLAVWLLAFSSAVVAVQALIVSGLLDTSGARVVAAFEVEHSTSIYSGIVRMLDLALGCALGAGTAMFLVAPDDRRDQVAQQLRRPAFSRVSELGIRYLPYGELRLHRAAIGRFGTGLKPILEVSQAL